MWIKIFIGYEKPNRFNWIQKVANASLSCHKFHIIPETAIRFYLLEACEIELTVFKVAGEIVKTLVHGKRAAGTYAEIWDGRNDRGELVASGVYFLQMRAGDFNTVQKMVLTR